MHTIGPQDLEFDTYVLESALSHTVLVLRHNINEANTGRTHSDLRLHRAVDEEALAAVTLTVRCCYLNF